MLHVKAEMLAFTDTFIVIGRRRADGAGPRRHCCRAPSVAAAASACLGKDDPLRRKP
jgi:hypothetical protein